MKPLFIDYQRERHSPWMGMAILLFSLVVSVQFVMRYAEVTGEIDKYEKTANKLGRAEMSNKVGARIANKQMIGQEVKSANDLLLELATPWNRLFQAIEVTAGNEVALLSIEPDAGKRSIKISGEARNLGAVLQYMKHLESEGTLINVYLQKHDFGKSGLNGIVRFSLIAAWKA